MQMHCGSGQQQRQRVCQDLHRGAGHGTALGRRQLHVACGFAAGRSAWPLQRRASDIRHRVEQVFHNIGDAVKASPPVRLANRAYQPVKREYDHQFRRFAFVYADFTSEETKRKWKWSRQMEREAKFWKSLVVFFQVLAATLLWEAVVPVSVVWGLVLPLFVSWVVFDRPIMNPIIVGLMLILPYKFIPGAAWRWF